MSVKPGDLIRDTDDGMLGLVVSPVRDYGQYGCQYVEVLWEGKAESQRVDLAVVQNRWIEVIKDETE